MRTFLLTIFVMSAIWSANADVARVVEGDTMTEYTYDVQSKTYNDVVHSIKMVDDKIALTNSLIDGLTAELVAYEADKIDLEAKLAELPVPVVPEPVVEPEIVIEPVVEEPTVVEPEIVPEPVVEPVIPSEEVVVDESVYPDLNSDSGINW